MNNFKNRNFFHNGMRDFQDLFDGRRTADAIEKHRKHYEFWDDEIELIQNSNFFFIASSWKGYIDCNIKSGDPGFVKIIKKSTIEYPEYDGNSMYRTAGATIHHDENSLNKHYGAKFIIRIKCEIYPNCPRYLPNFENKKPSVYVPRKGEKIPPSPEWKKRDYIKNILPKNDPYLKK